MKLNNQVASTYMNEKLIFSGHKVELYTFGKPIRVDFKRGAVVSRTDTADSKRSDNLLRAQRKVRQLIWANVGEYTKFLTLTYEETVLDIKQFKMDFAAFRKSMYRKGYKLKYLYVLERQKERGIKEGNEGCIHCHMVIFNDEYIPWEEIKASWHRGNIDIHILDGLRVVDNSKKDEKIQDLGAYVSKYITKDYVADANNRVYTCSTGLNKPVEVRKEEYQFINKNGVVDGIVNPNHIEYFENVMDTVEVKFKKLISYTYEDCNGQQQVNSFVYQQGVQK